jgi:hypothetical protein
LWENYLALTMIVIHNDCRWEHIKEVFICNPFMRIYVGADLVQKVVRSRGTSTLLALPCLRHLGIRHSNGLSAAGTATPRRWIKVEG